MQRSIEDIVRGEHVYMSQEGVETYGNQASLLEHGVVTRSVNEGYGGYVRILWDNGHENSYDRQYFHTQEEYDLISKNGKYKFSIAL